MGNIHEGNQGFDWDGVERDKTDFNGFFTEDVVYKEWLKEFGNVFEQGVGDQEVGKGQEGQEKVHIDQRLIADLFIRWEVYIVHQGLEIL